jgi:hypothetical protein
MRNLIVAALIAFSITGCAAIKADLSSPVPALSQCADQLAIAAAGDVLPVVVAALNDAPQTLDADLLALEAAGKAGLLCAVDAVAESAEATVSKAVTSVQITPAARLRATHFLIAHANK